MSTARSDSAPQGGPARAIATTVLGAVCWWAGVTWGVPALITAAYTRDIAVLSNLMPGRGSRPLDSYLAAWGPVARSSVVLVATGVLLVILALVLRHRYGLRRTDHASGSRAAASRDLLWLGVWCGLLTGLAEAYYYIVRVNYLQQETAGVIGISQHAVWMSPLSNVAVFALLGIVAAIAHRMLGDRLPFALVVAGCVWLGTFAVIMTTGRLHWSAALLLSLGAAVSVRRLITPDAGEVVAMARRTMPYLVIGIVAMGFGVRGLEWRRERRQLARAGQAKDGSPNVLFIVLDTERAASTSLHGARRETTPFLKSFAREGALFERAIAPASWTLPSHASMFTGRPWTEVGVASNTPLGDEQTTVAEVLSTRGYATAGFVANVKFLSDVFGLDQGFGRWEDQELDVGTIVDHSWILRSMSYPTRDKLGLHTASRVKRADEVNRGLLDWLDQRAASRPFFAFLNYFDAHAPYAPPAPWDRLYSDRPLLFWKEEGRPDASYTLDERQQLETSYASAITYLDNQLAELFASLRQRGLLDNTVVIITSDHGEEFGEHGTLGHGFGVTMPLIHVPLVMVYPGAIAAGTRVAEPVELADIASTILELTGGTDASIGGASLMSALTPAGHADGDHAAYAIDQGIESVVTRSHHFTRDRAGREHLYDAQSDPLESIDLIAEPAYAPLRDSLRTTLEQHFHAKAVPPKSQAPSR